MRKAATFTSSYSATAGDHLPVHTQVTGAGVNRTVGRRGFSFQPGHEPAWGLSGSLLRSGVQFQAGTTPYTPFGNNGPNGYLIELEGNQREEGAVALIVGRGFAKPGFAPPINGNTYAGPAMDVAAYTFVPVTRQ